MLSAGLLMQRYKNNDSYAQQMPKQGLIQELKQKAKSFRKDIIDLVYKAQSGHPGGSLSEIDMLVGLYYHKLKVDPKNPQWEDRDRFVLSKGHASPGLYVVLADKGFFQKSELSGFRKINSMLQGHPELNTPGIDFAGGTEIHIAFKQATSSLEVRDLLSKAGFKDSVVQHFGEKQDN